MVEIDFFFVEVFVLYKKWFFAKCFYVALANVISSGHCNFMQMHQKMGGQFNKK